MVKIGVLGAGAVGLATAVNIQQCNPNVSVTIIADKFGKDTTSYGAAGIFLPTYQTVKADKDSVKRWCQSSWDYFHNLCKTGQSVDAGAYFMEGFYCSNCPEPDELCQTIFFNTRLLSQEERDKKNLDFKIVHSFSTMGVTPNKFLPFLMRQFRQNGGIIDVKTVSSLSEFLDVYDIVVNCCGVNARTLVNDKTVFPVRGQLITVRAPWVKQWYMNTDNDTYLVPQFNGDVVLGGCRQTGNYSLEFDTEIHNDTLRRCEHFCPLIKGAEVVRKWVGLRPTREPVRVKKELMNFNGKKLKVVHNYGHDANGIAMSWGTAVDAANLVQEWIKQPYCTSRL